MNIKERIKNNLLIKWIKKNLGLSIMGGVVVLGASLTTILVTTVKEPWYKVLMINIQGGPSGRLDNDGYQFMLCIKTSVDSGFVNVVSDNDPPNYICGDNAPYGAEIFARSINGGDYPKSHNGMAWVKWKIQNDDGAQLPSWINIGLEDDDDFGRISVDFSKVTHPENFWVMVSAELGGITAYARMLHVDMQLSIIATNN